MSKTAVKIAARTFTYVDTDGPGEVAKGERVVADHALVRDFPQHFRSFSLDDELKVRSDRVAELREAAARPASREPLSRAGREERKQEDFWRSTTSMLERTRDDQPMSEERREQAFFDQALAQIEDVDAAELATINQDATRDYGFDRGWSRRVSD